MYNSDTLPFINPESHQYPDQLLLRDTAALCWDASYPVPVRLPEGLRVYWAEPSRDGNARRRAARYSREFSRHENSTVLALEVTLERTPRSDSCIIADGPVPLGSRLFTVTWEVCCTTQVYEHSFLPLL